MECRITAMAIRATKNNVLLGLVHRLHSALALEAADTFPVRFSRRLIDPVVRRKSRAIDRWLNRSGGKRAVAFFARTKSQDPNHKETPNRNDQTEKPTRQNAP